jgi:hypothetical protein
VFTCKFNNCGKPAGWLPVFMVPKPDGNFAGVAFRLEVCAECKVAITADHLLTDEGRQEIALAVKQNLGIDVDWAKVTMEWDPVPTEETDSEHFEATYECSDPELAPVWDEAVEVWNEFVQRPLDTNKKMLNLTALAVVALTEGYKHYRKHESHAGQMFLTAVMRSMAVQIEEQVGDSVKMRVKVKTGEKATLPNAEAIAAEIGENLNDQMPEGWGFTLVLSEFTEPGHPPGFSTYLSNCSREDAINVLRETADALERQ